jgi:small-conductance mechanosensitive channel
LVLDDESAPMVVPAPLEGALAQLLAAVQTVVAFVAIGLAIYLPGRYLLRPAIGALLEFSNTSEDVRNPLVRVMDVLVVLVAFYFATSLSGMGRIFTATEVITAAATLALGFAAQDVLGNLVSGVFIVTDPRFNIGDWVQWDGKEGIVEDISFRVTRVHTFDNELITVPNAELTTHAIVNPVAKERLRVSLTYGIAYDADLERARDLLVEEALAIENVVQRPPPTATVTELGDSAIQVTARFWITEPEHTDFVRIRSTYHQAVLDRFEAAGIEMPYPRQEISGRVAVSNGRP